MRKQSWLIRVLTVAAAVALPLGTGASIASAAPPSPPAGPTIPGLPGIPPLCC